MQGALDEMVRVMEEAAGIPGKRLEESMVLLKLLRNPLLTPCPRPASPSRVAALQTKEIHRPCRVSLLLLEKARDSGLGGHAHDLGDLMEEHNQVYVIQGWGAQQRQETGCCRHQKTCPITCALRESAVRQDLPGAASLIIRALAVTPWV